MDVAEPTLQEIVELAVELGRKRGISPNLIRWPSWASPPPLAAETIEEIAQLKKIAAAKLKKKRYKSWLRPGPRQGRKYPVNPDPNAASVPKREKEVLKHLTMGKATPQIAESMRISRNTVNTYVARLLRRTGIKNRRELVVRAIRWGKIDKA